MWVVAEGVDGNALEFWDKTRTPWKFVIALPTDSGDITALKAVADQMNALNVQFSEPVS